MDIKDYIQSGAIESYVLGLADEQEIAEIEQLKQQYPEVQQAIDEFSLAIEEQAFKNAVAPPPQVKERLLADLALPNVKPAHSESSLMVAYNSKNPEEPKQLTHTRRWRFLAAASIILLIVSAAANVYLYNRYSNASSRYQALLVQQTNLQANNQVYQTKLQQYQKAAEMMADQRFAMVQLTDPKGTQPNVTTVFWDKATKDVYLMANKLPPAAKNKQYQLWALVDGKPVDAGMVDPDCSALCKMKNIPKAQAFAITLEKAGGSPVPTMDQLFVMGNV